MPEEAGLLIERLSVRSAQLSDRLEGDAALTGAVVAVAAASRSLARIIATDSRAIEVLESCRMPVVAPGPIEPTSAESAEELVRRKHLGMLRIAARDLLGLDPLEEVGLALSRLADGVLEGACRLAAPEVPIALIAMGKLGAEELNYASDVDVVIVGSEGGPRAATAARDVLSIVAQAFRVDVGLRPEGRSGALVRTLDSYVAYWERWARPWEYQALLKARAAAGDKELGARFEVAAAERVWSRPVDADALAEIRSMKARAEALVSTKGLDHRELKRGVGGIRDVEFAVQLLQLVHGRRDAALRLRGTLAALGELSLAGYVAPSDASVLALAYRFLRTVEHRLQLFDEAQVHTVPSDRQSRERLAKVLGIAGTAEGGAAERFDAILTGYQGRARAVHERLFFRPLLEAFATRSALGTPARATEDLRPNGALGPHRVPESEGRLGADAAAERLAAFGFRDAQRTRQALGELTRGFTRSSRLMHQLLPLLLDWLSESPDPDQGLIGLRTLAGTPHRRELLVTAFRESPELARRLCVLLGTSRRLGEIVARHPDLVALLADDQALGAPARADLERRMLGAAAQPEERRVRAIRNLAETTTVRIAACDLLGLSGLPATGGALSDLAAATVQAGLHVVAPPVPMAVVAMGSFGGCELSYGSDLDVLVLFEGNRPEDADAAERATGALFRLLNGATPSEGIAHIDASLRPEGRHGPLARSLGAFEEYHSRWADTWERQALLRARTVAGDPGVAARFSAIAERALWERPFGAEEERAIRVMKARIERERIPPREDPQFHLKLGRGSISDVEWTIQLLQLRHRVPAAATRDAIAELEKCGALTSADARVLSAALSFCERTRNRWHLVGNYLAGAGGIVGNGADALPRQPELQSRLARSLHTTPSELRESYRRVTRRSRRVVERLFYGL